MMNHSVNNNTFMGLVCSFKFKSLDQFNPPFPPPPPPRTASIFGHLFSCGIIDGGAGVAIGMEEATFGVGWAKRFKVFCN